MSDSPLSNKSKNTPSAPEAEGLPLSRAQPGHDFTLQAVMEMQKSIGSLERSIDSIGEKLDKQGTSINKINLRLTFAGGVVLAVSVAAGYVANNRFDEIVQFLAK